MTQPGKSPAPYQRDIGFWRSLIQHVQLVARLVGDRRVPFWTKSIPILSVVYLFWPADLIPGAIVPVLGAMDDLAAVLVGFKVFIELCPPDVVTEHRAVLAGEVLQAENTIDGEVHVVDDDAPSDGPIIDLD
ncbi:MAG: YkvA family protein [Anaerolineales bacterium]